MYAVSAAAEDAHQLFAGCIRRDHEVAKEDAAAGWTLVGAAMVAYLRPTGYSPCGRFEAAFLAMRTDIGQAALLPLAAPSQSGSVAWETPFYREGELNAIASRLLKKAA